MYDTFGKITLLTLLALSSPVLAAENTFLKDYLEGGGNNSGSNPNDNGATAKETTPAASTTAATSTPAAASSSADSFAKLQAAAGLPISGKNGTDAAVDAIAQCVDYVTYEPPAGTPPEENNALRMSLLGQIPKYVVEFVTSEASTTMGALCTDFFNYAKTPPQYAQRMSVLGGGAAGGAYPTLQLASSAPVGLLPGAAAAAGKSSETAQAGSGDDGMMQMIMMLAGGMSGGSSDSGMSDSSLLSGM